MTARRVSGVNVADIEEIVQAHLHSITGHGIKIETVPGLGHVFTRLILEQRHNIVVHKIGQVGVVRRLLAGRGTQWAAASHISCEIIDTIANNSHLLLLLAQFGDMLGRETDVTLLEETAKAAHLLKVPVGTSVIGKVAEIVVLGVEILGVDESRRNSSKVGVLVVQGDLGVNVSILALAKCADLHGEKSRDILASIVEKQLLVKIGRVVLRSIGGQIIDVAADRNQGTLAAGLAVVGGQLSGAVDVLRGANQHGKDNNKKGSSETEKPNEDVNGELLSPSHADILARHTTNPANDEVGDKPSQEVHHEDPALAAWAVLVLFDLDKVLLVASFSHLLASIKVFEHVAGANRRDTSLRTCVVTGCKIASLGLFAIHDGGVAARDELLLGGKERVAVTSAVALAVGRGHATRSSLSREMCNLDPASLAEEDTSGTDLDLITGPAALFDDNFGALAFAANENRLGIGEAKELSKGQEQAKVGRAQALADLGNTECLNLCSDTLAVKLVGNAAIVRLQAEDTVNIGARISDGLLHIVKSREELSRSALLQAECVVATALVLLSRLSELLEALQSVLLLLAARTNGTSSGGALAGHDAGSSSGLGADGSLHDSGSFVGVGDSLESVLAEEASDKFALGRVDHVEQVARDELAILFDEALDGVVDLTSKVLNGKGSGSVFRHEVAARQLGRGSADLDGGVLAVKALSETLEKLHISAVAAGLVVENAEQTVAGFEHALDSIGVIKVRGRGDADFFGLEHLGLAVKEVVEGDIVESLGGGVVEQLVENRSGRALLDEAREVDNGDCVGNVLLGSTETLVGRFHDPGDEQGVQGPGELVGMGTSAGGVKHDGNALLLDHSRLVTESGLQIVGVDAEEGSDNGKNLLVLDSGKGVAALVREATTVATNGAGVVGRLEVELTDVENGSEDLADLGNVIAGELELLESSLEELKALGIVDADLELGGVAEILPASGTADGGVIKSQMCLFGGTGTSEEVVERMEVALAGGNVCDAASLESVVEQLTTDEDGVGGGGGVVLELVEETRLGGGRCGGRLCSCEGVKDVGGQGKLVGERRRRLVEESSQEVGAEGGFAGAGFTTGSKLARLDLQEVWRRVSRKIIAYRNTTAWFSERWPSRSQARSAMSSAPAMALPSLPPSGPLAEDV